MCKQAIIGFGFTFDWLRVKMEIIVADKVVRVSFNQSLSVVQQNQSKQKFLLTLS